MVLAAASLPRRRISLLLAGAVLCSLVLSAWIPQNQAAEAATKATGLSISPLYQYTQVQAGSPQNGSITIADLNSTPMTVSLSVKRFSVSDYTYDYSFSAPGNDWINLGQTEASLQPGQSQKVAYSLNVPAGAAPGGYYYTLLASANLGNHGLNTTVQAASLLYVTVAGQLVQTGRIEHSKIPWFSFGKGVTYSLDALNTGNVHYFVYTSGSLHGMFLSKQSAALTYLLMPGHLRRLTGTIPAPWLPGIYHASYGYHTDSSSKLITRSRSILFIPPWFVAAVVIILLFGGKLWHRKKSITSKE